jgi:glucuronate isomerase
MPEGEAWRVPDLETDGNTPETILHALTHALLAELDRRGFHLQLFLGMEQPTPGYTPKTSAHRNYAVNDSRRIAVLHDLFDRYAGCTFEIVNAAELSALDIVQAARIYPNVFPGGLWWFNFRSSTYRANMQYRLEALPAPKATLVASDARCIEWAYAKTTHVKLLLAEFLWDQVTRGWLDVEAAIYTARNWLYETASTLYPPPAAAAADSGG